MSQADKTDMATLCATHLHEEERLLAAALPIVRAVQSMLSSRAPDLLPLIAQQHFNVTLILDEMHRRRREMRTNIGGHLGLETSDVRLTEIVARMPAETKTPLVAQLAHVRRLADELVETNHRLSLHLRIYLDAYHRLLRDLTGTASGSGRYGPQGRAELPEYRPLLQIHG